MTTIKDIARKVGVSIAVVSYVINNGPRAVAPETEARVREVMRELSYHPNARAQQFARQRSNCLGLIFNGLSDSSFEGMYFSAYSRGIVAFAEKAAYNVMLFLNRGPDFYNAVGKMGLVDGVILAGSALSTEGMAQLRESGFPAVVIGQRIDGLAWVTQDDEGSAYTATRHLLERGYRQIGFLGQALTLSYGRDRLDGYRRALEEAEIPFNPRLVSVPGTPRDIPGFDEVAALMEAGSEALLTDKELNVIEHLHTLGLSVPDHVALIGLDEDLPESRSRGITTMLAPKFEIGVAATEMICSLIGSKPDIPPSRIIPMELQIRDTSPRYTRR